VRVGSQGRRAVPASAAVIQGSHGAQLLDIGNGLPTTVKFAVIDKMVKNIPFLDVGLRKFTRMSGGFGVKADNDRLQELMDGWLGCSYVPGIEDLNVCGVQRGLQAFHARHCRDMLQYGIALSEIALSGSGKDIDSVWPIPSAEIRCRKTADGRREFGQQRMGGFETTWFERQDLLLFDAANPRGDDWNGRPLIESCQWVADTLLTIEQAIKQMWWRHGAPSFAIWAEIDPEHADGAPGQDGQGMTDQITGAIRGEWTKGLKDRWENEGIRDFVFAGSVKLHFQAIGADVKELSFEIPFRSLMEQVIATIELAPFMLGVSWATTERMSQHQADAIMACVEDVRRELEPDYMHLCELKQQLIGVKGRFEPAWEGVTLRDETETSRARLANAQAARFEQQVALELWRQGVIDQEGYAEAQGFEEVVNPQDQPAAALPAFQAAQTLAARGQAAFASYP